MLKCVVCGDTSTAGRHYKTIVCLGCKSFFRRAIVKKRQYFCEKDGNCDISERSGRQSCRACRLKKCLDVGMTKDVLHPKRDTIGIRYAKKASPSSEQHSPVPSTSTLNSPTISNPINPITGPMDQDYLRIIGKLASDDCRIRSRKYDTFRAHTEAIKLAQTVMGEDAIVSGQGSLTSYYIKGLRLVQKYDMSMVTSGELYSMVEWAQGLDEFRSLPLHVQTYLLKKFAVYHIVIETCYYTANNSDVNDIWMITNGACMPRYVEMLPEASQKIISPDRKWRQEKLWTQMTNKCIDEVVIPLRRLNLRPEELVTLKMILFYQYNKDLDNIPFEDDYELWSKIISEETSVAISAARDRVIHALFAYYRSINMENYAERFGNVILSISGIVSAASALLEAYQVMRLFVCRFDSITEQLLFDQIS